MGDTVAVRSLGDLVAAVPLMLGFEVTESVVLVGVGPTEQGPVSVVAVVRLDLVDVREVGTVCGPVVERGASAMFVVVYGSSIEQAYASSSTVVDSLAAIAVQVLDVVLVVDGQWQSAQSRGPQPVPESSACVAELVAMGHAALPSRGAVLALVQPAAESVGWPGDPVPEEAGLSAWRAVLTMPEQVAAAQEAQDVPDEVLATAAAWVQSKAARDGVLGVLMPRLRDVPGLRDLSQVLPGEWAQSPQTATLMRYRLLALSRRLDGPQAVPWLCLVAMAMGDGGDTVLSGMVLDRAAALDPADTLVPLLQQSLALGLKL